MLEEETLNAATVPTLSHPGLLVMDVDSTLIDEEVIDELGVAAGVGFTSITVAWLSQLNAFAMIVISMMLAVISKGAETLQTRLAVPASISDIITGILLFCMLGCEFFINYRLIFRSSKTEKEAAKE